MAISSHDAKADAEILHKAFKGLGTDEDAVISVLGHRTKEQLEQVDHEYRSQSSNGTSLAKAVEKELSGSFQQLAQGVVTNVLEFKKKTLKEAVEGLGTRESALIDVLSQSTNAEIREIAKDAELYQKVLSDVSGDFKAVIINLYKGERPSGRISDAEAEALAQQFYKAGEGKIGTDENKYIDIITHHSIEALQQVDHAYEKKHKHGLIKAVKSETSGDFEDVLIALLKSRDEYYADRLHHSIAGLGTDERVLIYVFSVLQRHELKEVASVYQRKYKETLADAIKGDTSFNFKKLLLALLE